MKRALPLLLILIGLVTAILGWMYRTQIREFIYSMQQPSLPTEQTFQPTTTAPSIVPTSTKSKPPTKPTVVDPFLSNPALSESVNLAVPFLSQAPKGDWSMPYEEACEEATAIMVDAYYKGRTTKFQPDEGDKAILALVAAETRLLGYYKDTSATATARLITSYFHYPHIVLKKNPTVQDIKQALANGYPVILPAYGKALPNPNFRNGGPVYHMVLIKGYLKDGRWITNDTGTRLGSNFLYSQDSLMQANHDWNNGDVAHGDRVILVVLPN